MVLALGFRVVRNMSLRGKHWEYISLQGDLMQKKGPTMTYLMIILMPCILNNYHIEVIISRWAPFKQGYKLKL